MRILGTVKLLENRIVETLAVENRQREFMVADVLAAADTLQQRDGETLLGCRPH